MTRLENFEEWERETLDSFPDEKKSVRHSTKP